MPRDALPIIDHFILPCADMDAAQAWFERAGFAFWRRLTFQGKPMENNSIYLPGCFLELMALRKDIEPPTDLPPQGRMFMRIIKARTGLAGLAGQTFDRDRDCVRAHRLGLAVIGDSVSVKSQFEEDGRTVSIEYDLATLAVEGAPLMWIQVGEDVKPFDRSSRLRDYANGAVGIDAAVLVADDPAMFGGLSEFFTDAAAPCVDGVLAWRAGPAVEVMTPAAFERKYAPLDLPAEPRRPYIAGLRFLSKDLRQTETCLRDNKLAVAWSGDELLVAPDPATGAVVSFAHAD